MNMSKVDVLLPCGNAPWFLDQAAASILDQLGLVRNLILVDDTTTQEAKAAVDKVAATDCRILLVRNSGEGLVDALNTGLELVATEFFARMDADDIALPGRLFHQLLVAERYPQTVGVGGLVEYVDARGLHHRTQEAPTAGLPLEPREIRTQLRKFNCLFHPTMLLRTESVRFLGGYSAEFPHVEDYLLWLQLSELGDLRTLPRVVLQYRIHEQSIGSLLGSSQQNSLRALQARLKSGELPGVGAQPAIERGQFAAVIFQEDDEPPTEVLQRLRSQSSTTLLGALIIRDQRCAAHVPLIDIVRGKTDFVVACSHEEGPTQLAAFARLFPPDLPIVVTTSTVRPDREWVSTRAQRLLQDQTSWFSASLAESPQWRSSTRVNCVSRPDESSLRQDLILESRVLWRDDLELPASGLLTDLLAAWENDTRVETCEEAGSTPSRQVSSRVKWLSRLANWRARFAPLMD